MKKSEIRKILLDKYEIDASRIKIKAELVELLQEAESKEFSVDDFEPTEDEPVINDVIEDVRLSEDIRPSMSHSEWSNYVMKQFEKDELLKGNPTVNGLRRVAELLLGPVVRSVGKVVQCPNPDNEGRAVVEYEVTFLWTDDDEVGQPHERTFGDAADVYVGNTDDEYARYPTATACTRAEARALRKALKLQAVAAEELTNKPVAEANFDFISTTQKVLIKKLCRDLDINIHKFINFGELDYDDINEISHAKAVAMITHLNSLQQDVEKVPNNLKGFVE